MKKTTGIFDTCERARFHRGMRNLFTAMFIGLTLVSADAAWDPGAWTELGVLPAGAVVWQRTVTGPDGAVRVAGVNFSASKATFRLVDNPPEARGNFPEILAQTGAIAGINGGYFHPDYRPLGLAVSEGREIHGFERAKLLSGVLAVRGNRIELVRSGAFVAGKGLADALQAGPWLVEHGAPIAGLNAERKARRSLVATDGKGNWAIIATGPLTLAETGAVMALKNLSGAWSVRDALNLDGGSSTALWAGLPAKAFEIFSFGTVRNYLAIVPRQK